MVWVNDRGRGVAMQGMEAVEAMNGLHHDDHDDDMIDDGNPDQRKRARRHQNAEAQRRYRGRQKGKSSELEVVVQQLRQNVDHLEARHRQAIGGQPQLQAYHISPQAAMGGAGNMALHPQSMQSLVMMMSQGAAAAAAAANSMEGAGHPGGPAGGDPHQALQQQIQLHHQHMQLHQQQQAQQAAQQQAQEAQRQQQAQLEHAQQLAWKQQQEKITPALDPVKEAGIEAKLKEQIRKADAEAAHLKQRLSLVQSTQDVAALPGSGTAVVPKHAPAPAAGTMTKSKGRETSVAAAVAGRERVETMGRCIEVLTQALSRVRPGEPCDEHTSDAIRKAVRMMRESSKRHAKHRFEMMAPRQEADITDWQDNSQYEHINIPHLLQEYINEQLQPQSSTGTERQSYGQKLEGTMGMRSGAYLDALQEIYSERAKLQDALGSLNDQSNLMERMVS